MTKSKKLALSLALMMGATVGAQAIDTNNAEAYVSDKFRLEVNGVYSYFHDPAGDYYTTLNTMAVGNKASGGDGTITKTNKNDAKHVQNGWNNYTRVVFRYDVDKNTKFFARLHSGYDLYSDGYNYDKNSSYFDQGYFTFKDPVANVTYLIGKRGMTLGQSMVYNGTGNQTGVQITFGNWWDPNNLMLFWGDRKNGNRIMGAQGYFSPVKNLQLGAAYFRADVSKCKTYNLDKDGNVIKPSDKTTKVAFTHYDYDNKRDNFVDLTAKYKFHGCTLVGEWARNTSGNAQYVTRDDSDRAWFVELYTGPTNDFGSELPNQKVGTHVFSMRWQNIGRNGTVVHNNTFYNDMKGLRLDYGYVFKKGMSVDLVYGRMKYRGAGSTVWTSKGDYNNIIVGSLSFKLK